MSTAADDLFSAPFERLLTEQCTPSAVRAVEQGASPVALWQVFEQSGFLDALVPEAAGGAGLSLAQALPLMEAEGRFAVPLPLAQTMFVRGALARDGAAAPAGSIAIAPQWWQDVDGAMSCPAVPYGLVADWVAVETPEGWLLLPASAAQRQATGIHGSLVAALRWPALPSGAHRSSRNVSWPDVGAALTAALLAGGLSRVLQMTVDFANQREQFGRSIGKFQAIQHQLAVMAEQVAAARMAAALGCSDAVDGLWPLPLRAALAKARSSEAAALAAHTAHAVHGAIGITAEFDLHLYTRRLHEGRAAYGSETHWNRTLGRALLANRTLSTLDFMRSALMPRHPESL